MVPDTVSFVLLALFGVVGLLFSLWRFMEVRAVSLRLEHNNIPQSGPVNGSHHEASSLLFTSGDEDQEGGRAKASFPEIFKAINEIGNAITTGASSFLRREYVYISVFMAIFACIVLAALAPVDGFVNALFSAIAFLVGASTSLLCGYIGMRVAVFSNTRTTIRAITGGYAKAFQTSFKAGMVVGFSLTSIGVLLLLLTILVFHAYFQETKNIVELFEAVSAFGLGGSAMALFGRVGGGIFTKAADVGADLVGKVEQGIPEDDVRNPGTIADNVGDNVGDIAGMGADLFGSFAEASCAAMVLSSQSNELREHWSCLLVPVLISAFGIIVSLITSFLATDLMPVKSSKQIEPRLKQQLLVSTILMTPVLFVLCWVWLPDTFHVSTRYLVDDMDTTNWKAFICIACGLWAGLLIGYITEYYTSHSNKPVREVSGSCHTGAATNIIYGLALGYQSTIIPVVAMSVTIYISHKLCSMYGISLAALGILSTLAIGLTIDSYGPISDNAGGIAEMSGCDPGIREITDALDAAGNTTAAIGKGFAIGSAAFVSLALFGAFVTKAEIATIDLMEPYPFAGLLIGAMLPYWFSAMTMRSVGQAALAMVQEVRRQFHEKPGIMTYQDKPDYAKCVSISTDASLREMILPGLLVILTPIIVGFLFGKEALAGVLTGALVSGVQLAISAANSGGAWDNAKKYIEAGHLVIDGEVRKKGSPEHTAAVIGDTVGDPMKDTSGPSLNILIKLMAIISLVFAPAINQYGGVLNKI